MENEKWKFLSSLSFVYFLFPFFLYYPPYEGVPRARKIKKVLHKKFIRDRVVLVVDSAASSTISYDVDNQTSSTTNHPPKKPLPGLFL